MTKKNQAVIELFIAASIWGFGFTATIWAIESFSSIAISLVRFFGACLILLPFFYFNSSWVKEINKENLKLSLAPGVFLGLTLIFQTWGLEYTTATKSSFITTLYVVFVPLLEVFVVKKKISRLHSIWVILALIGTGLIVQIQIAEINFGDILTLLCSLFATAHIVSLSLLGPKIKSPMVFNFYQSFYSGLLALVLLPFFDVPHWKGFEIYAFIGIFSLTFGSTILAFALQVKAQKNISASLASILFLLESPFAVLFAVLLLNETMTTTQIVGGLLIIISSYLAVRVN